MRLTTLMLCFFLSLGGCFPAVMVDRPAFTGLIVDNAGRPVGGAVVTVWSPQDGVQIAETLTGASGRFNQASDSGRWFIYFLSQDNPPAPVYSVGASAGSASGKTANINGGQIKPFGLGFTRTVDVGTIAVR